MIRLAYRGTPPKMTTAEYTVRTMIRSSGFNGAEHALRGMGVNDRVKVPRAYWRTAIIDALSKHGYDLITLNLSNKNASKFAVTIAVLAHTHLHAGNNPLLLFTPTDVIVFREGFAWDSSANLRPVVNDAVDYLTRSRSVRRRVTAAFYIVRRDVTCECADPVVFGHGNGCQRSFTVGVKPMTA